MRIRRYLGLLESKDEFRCYLGAMHVYIDLNYPRSKRNYDREDFPQFHQMLEDLETRSIGLVFTDLQETVGFYDDYSWIRHSLTRVGVRVVNAFYDSEKVLEERLQAPFRGRAYVQEIDDGSDFVNFFPTLSASVARAALDQGSQFVGRQNDQFAAFSCQLDRIGERKPYIAGQEPFVQVELINEWHRRLEGLEAKERVERRQHEQIFRLAPRMRGLLIDEDSSSLSEARKPEELSWAEERVGTLGFERIVEDRCVSYVFHGDGFDVYADIRSKPKLLFYIYRLPKQAKSSDRSNAYFELPDRCTRDIPGKWRAALATAMRRYAGK